MADGEGSDEWRCWWLLGEVGGRGRALNKWPMGPPAREGADAKAGAGPPYCNVSRLH